MGLVLPGPESTDRVGSTGGLEQSKTESETRGWSRANFGSENLPPNLCKKLV